MFANIFLDHLTFFIIGIVFIMIAIAIYMITNITIGLKKLGKNINGNYIIEHTLQMIMR